MFFALSDSLAGLNNMLGKVEDTANRLRLQIQTGVYGEYSRLPTMETLARQFEVSRSTIIKVIKLLQAEGLLDDERYVGTMPKYEPLQRASKNVLFTPTPIGNEQYYNYILLFPDGQNLSGVTFYVGKGTWYKVPLIQRLDMHEHEAQWAPEANMIGYAINGFKVKAIRYIWAAGKSVAKQVVFETIDEKEVIKSEKQAIKQYTNPYLTNHENYAYCKINEWPDNSIWRQKLRGNNH